MGARGSIPKDPEKRVRRNKMDGAEVILPSGEFDPLGPDLPQFYGPEGRKVRYAKSTRDRYRRWQCSPQSRHFLASDWDRLNDLAPLWDQLAKTPGDVRTLEMVVKIEKTLGAAIEDRLRARIHQAPPAADPKPDAPSSSRRNLRVV